MIESPGVKIESSGVKIESSQVKLESSQVNIESSRAKIESSQVKIEGDHLTPMIIILQMNPELKMALQSSLTLVKKVLTSLK